ncbi:hypothetical protein [Paenibacillus hexagrammi]|uniref:HEPN domain-containing protein n=1 Tax=Paenibacillus hexagrammi TaxID=2908839 RepID=A0ABY3SGW1_9BACL|nr:hypothetical protein [Paenibacillus sp. YPD9-1]UJF32172.1 hypothetical protein L0M14_20930 [Paenibacillus sp. YPD9-1]
MSEFQIKSPVLQAAFFGSHYCENSKLVTNGYINNDNHKIARAFLSYCSEILFNIRRFPGFEEDYRLVEGNHYFKTFSILNLNEINEAIKELTKLYNHTQTNLLSHPSVSNGKIVIKRSLSQFERKQVSKQLKEKNNVLNITLISLHRIKIMEACTNTDPPSF